MNFTGNSRASNNAENSKPVLKRGKGRPPGGPYICFECSKSFKYKVIFTKHLKDEHNIRNMNLKSVTNTSSIFKKNLYAKPAVYKSEYSMGEDVDIKEEIIQGKTLQLIVL